MRNPLQIYEVADPFRDNDNINFNYLRTVTPSAARWFKRGPPSPMQMIKPGKNLYSKTREKQNRQGELGENPGGEHREAKQGEKIDRRNSTKKEWEKWDDGKFRGRNPKWIQDVWNLQWIFAMDFCNGFLQLIFATDLS